MNLQAARLRPSLRRSVPLLALWLLFVSPAARAQTVNFPDPNLQSAIANALYPLSPPFTQAQLLALTNLQAGFYNIQDTEGLQYASNLTVLSLNEDPVTNFSGVASLTNLTEFDIYFASLTNISFMTNLLQLRFSYLTGNNIADVSPLAGLTNLQFLSFYSDAAMTNPAALAPLVNLTNLDLGLDALTNIDFFTNFPQLQSISLYGDSGVSNFAPFLEHAQSGRPGRGLHRAHQR